MRSYILYTLISANVFISCSCSSSKDDDKKDTTEVNQIIKKGNFTGNYAKAFNDLHDLHCEAAKKNGITPLNSREEAESIGNKLVLIPDELAYYKTDKLTHSIPYLVPKASQLLVDISVAFGDSLKSKGFPPYKLILTSLTRTNDDIKNLTRRNTNASHTSAHCYGTTFDISWKRYERLDSNKKEIPTDKLKFILGQVLFDLKQNERCYIKHERRQACFHITVR